MLCNFENVLGPPARVALALPHFRNQLLLEFRCRSTGLGGHYAGLYRDVLSPEVTNSR